MCKFQCIMQEGKRQHEPDGVRGGGEEGQGGHRKRAYDVSIK